MSWIYLSIICICMYVCKDSIMMKYYYDYSEYMNSYKNSYTNFCMKFDVKTNWQLTEQASNIVIAPSAVPGFSSVQKRMPQWLVISVKIPSFPTKTQIAASAAQWPALAAVDRSLHSLWIFCPPGPPSQSLSLPWKGSKGCWSQWLSVCNWKFRPLHDYNFNTMFYNMHTYWLCQCFAYMAAWDIGLIK